MAKSTPLPFRLDIERAFTFNFEVAADFEHSAGQTLLESFRHYGPKVIADLCMASMKPAFDSKLSKANVIGMIQQYLDRGEDMTKLWEFITTAWLQSGVLGSEDITARPQTPSAV